MFSKILRHSLRRSSVPSYGSHTGYGFNHQVKSISVMSPAGKLVCIGSAVVFFGCTVKMATKSPYRDVPKSEIPFDKKTLAEIKNLLQNSKKITILTGAGVSTASGIPDYRSPGVGTYARDKNWKPILGPELAQNIDKRTRYWARNFVGFTNFYDKDPNIVHYFLTDWYNGNLKELQSNQFNFLITQNVDGLHFKSGIPQNKDSTSDVCVELHGSSFRTNCLDCGSKFKREDIQKIFHQRNPDFLKKYSHQVTYAADADSILTDDIIAKFKMIECPNCGSDRLKPDIVFFGDNVRGSVVDRCYEKVEESDLLLVLGSTMEVYSSFRFARRAHDLGIPIVSVNLGRTRADKLIDVKLECQLTDFVQSFQ